MKGDRDLFARVQMAAQPYMVSLLQRWLPGGQLEGGEYICRNPKRDDSRPGSFKINVHTGRWADFATGDKGGDVIALAAYLFEMSQLDAARNIAHMLGVSA